MVYYTRGAITQGVKTDVYVHVDVDSCVAIEVSMLIEYQNTRILYLTQRCFDQIYFKL